MSCFTYPRLLRLFYGFVFRFPSKHPSHKSEGELKHPTVRIPSDSYAILECCRTNSFLLMTILFSPSRIVSFSEDLFSQLSTMGKFTCFACFTSGTNPIPPQKVQILTLVHVLSATNQVRSISTILHTWYNICLNIFSVWQTVLSFRRI